MDVLRRHGLIIAATLSGLVYLGMSGSGNAYGLIPGLLSLVLLGAGLSVYHLRWGAVATALVALGANAYLLQRKCAASGESACNLDATINCDVVNQSVYSEIGGLPITLFGVAFYAGLALAAYLSRADDDEGRFDQINALFGLITVAYSIFLAWASTQIGAFCVVCITIYLCNVVLLMSGLIGLRRHERALFADLGGVLTSRAMGGLLVVFGLVVAVGAPEFPCGQPVARIDTKAPGAADRLAQLYDKPAGPISIPTGSPVLGAPDAPYTVVEFADFGCPHCARAKKELEDLVKARPDVKVIFRVFPLDGECNPGLEPSGQQPSPRCEASRAAYCAHEQGRFWDFAGQLFTNQGYFAPEQLAFMAETVGLDMDAFATCMREPSVEARVLADAKAGGEAGILGTPSLFLFGVTEGPVFVTQGVPAVLQLVEAHADGITLPAP